MTLSLVPLRSPLEGAPDDLRWTRLVASGGRTLLVGGGSNDGAVHVWDALSGARRETLRLPTRGITSRLRVTDTSATLAVVYREGNVLLWDVHTGKERHLRGGGGRATSVRFVTVGNDTLVVTLDDRGWSTWDLSTSRPWAPVSPTGGARWFRPYAFDGRPWVVFADLGGTVRIRSLDGQSKASLADPPPAARRGAVITSPDGRPWLSTLADDGTFSLHDLTTGQRLGSWTVVNPPGWQRHAVVEDELVVALGGGVIGLTEMWRGTVDDWRDDWHVVHGRSLWRPEDAGNVPWSRFVDLGGEPSLMTSSASGTVSLWDIDGAPLGPPLLIGVEPWAKADVVAAGGSVIVAALVRAGAPQRFELVDRRTRSRTTRYRSDDVGTPDALDRSVEAEALADLITARSATPPLAVGLFGEWGEGKSHFLGLLRTAITDAAQRGDDVAHRHVRQVRFNAWHYAETDLWASLVTEVFTQLGRSEDGSTADDRRRQARLATEVAARRGTRERLEAAQEHRRELQAATRRPGWFTAGRERALQEAVAPFPTVDATELVDAVTSPLAWWRLQVLRLRPLVGTARRRLAVVAGLAFAVAAVVLVTVGAQLVAQVAGTLGLLTLLTLVTTAAGSLRTAGARVTSALATARRIVDEQRGQVRTALEAADAEVAALERELGDLSAAGALAGFAGGRASEGPYRGSFGTMTRIREDFAHMARLLAETRDETTTGTDPDALPRIDRIVLHIDDLDRCPPGRVVAVLEATHLLLALPLFVVVVAVDPRWLLRAVAVHYRDLLHHDDGTDGTATPAQYLEKIFQVVLTLPPLDATGYCSLVTGLVGDPPVPEEEPVVEETGPAPAPTARPDPDRSEPTTTAVATRLPVLPPPRVAMRTDPLELTGDQHTLLRLLGPPLITTPRSAKRLVNSVGLLSSLRRIREERSSGPLPDSRTSTVDMMLLAGAIGFPTRDLLGRLGRSSAGRWNAFLDEIGALSGYSDLASALREATAAARERGVDLPPGLLPWQEASGDVARLTLQARPEDG